jgi:hypothetical protein
VGDFEDEIRKKFEEGNLNYDPSKWEEMSQNLSSNPSYSQFENDINEKLNEGSIETPSNAWDNFNDKFNSKSKFEEQIKKKLNNDSVEYNSENWEKLAEKLEYQKLNSFERILKSKLSKSKIKYNPAHWSALEKSLIKSSNIKFLGRAAVVIGFLLAGFGINSFSDIGNEKTEKRKNLVNLKSSQKKYVLDTNRFSEINNSKSVTRDFTSANNPDEKSYKPLSLGEMFNVSKRENETIFSDLKPNRNLVTTKQELNQSNNGFIVLENMPLQEYCASIELLFKKSPVIRKSILNYQIHPGATIWLNFWDNSAITGLYAKNYISIFYDSDWEFIDANKNQLGELSFLQPLTYRAAFERQLNKNFSLGTFYRYELLKNWNNRKANISISYSKSIRNKLDFKVGLSGSLNSNNLAVNRLTLREKSLNSDYIFSTDLGNLKSRQQQNAVLDLGCFINHKKFFIGYNQNNIASYNVGVEDEVTLKKHTLMTGIHTPKFKGIQTSLLFKYERELFNSFSPSIGATYENRVFAALEYEDLSNKKISIGYQHKRRFKLQFTYSIRDLTQYKNENLNINNFSERQGNLSGGINYIF